MLTYSPQQIENEGAVHVKSAAWRTGEKSSFFLADKRPGKVVALKKKRAEDGSRLNDNRIQSARNRELIQLMALNQSTGQVLQSKDGTNGLPGIGDQFLTDNRKAAHHPAKEILPAAKAPVKEKRSFLVHTKMQDNRAIVQRVKRNQDLHPPRQARVAANRAMGLDPRGRGRMRQRRQPIRFEIDNGPARPRLEAFGNPVRQGLHPGRRYRHRIMIRYTGTRAGDFALANAAFGYAATPPGWVWHHYHDYDGTVAGNGYGTMYLMTVRDHAVGHCGGVYQWEQATGRIYG